MNDLRIDRPWNEVPKWAKVKLKGKVNGDVIIFAESYENGARAWPSVMGAPYFDLYADNWEVVEYRPTLKASNGFMKGCTVQVVNNGLMYTAHTEAFKSTGLDMEKWAKMQSLKVNKQATYLGTVVDYPHLMVIENKEQYYLIGIGGVELMSDPTANGFLQEAINCIGDRASERDTDSERSMLKTVKTFNEMFGTALTEEQGWQFMTLLKMSRSQGGNFRRDDYVDGAAYFALAGEASGNS